MNYKRILNISGISLSILLLFAAIGLRMEESGEIEELKASLRELDSKECNNVTYVNKTYPVENITKIINIVYNDSFLVENITELQYKVEFLRLEIKHAREDIGRLKNE